jgi:hypothetical protein
MNDSIRSVDNGAPDVIGKAAESLKRMIKGAQSKINIRYHKGNRRSRENESFHQIN